MPVQAALCALSVTLDTEKYQPPLQSTQYKQFQCPAQVCLSIHFYFILFSILFFIKMGSFFDIWQRRWGILHVLVITKCRYHWLGVFAFQH